MSEARQIIATLLSNDVRGELLALFHRNPGLVDTIDGVARRIGRLGTAIENDVQELVSLGILKTKMIGTSEVLILDRAKDREILDAVANHIKTVRRTEN